MSGILLSNWETKHYTSIDSAALKESSDLKKSDFTTSCYLLQPASHVQHWEEHSRRCLHLKLSIRVRFQQSMILSVLHVENQKKKHILLHMNTSVALVIGTVRFFWRIHSVNAIGHECFHHVPKCVSFLLLVNSASYSALTPFMQLCAQNKTGA